jgi:Fe-S-cluster-containing hydrogenase component 2
MEVCPSTAVRRNPETGAMMVDDSRCVGCKMCVLACPLGSIGFDTYEGKSKKCDLCGGDPECVKVCTARALEYGEASELVLEMKREIAVKVREFFREGWI